MDLIDYIYDECHRQNVTNYGDFAKAWQFASDVSDDFIGSINFGHFVQDIARFVEPVVNLTRHVGDGVHFDNLRTSHVGFVNGGSAAPVGEVRERFDRWCEHAFDLIADPIGNLIEAGRDVDVLIHQLLDIHPWVDGNGRTASILRNWMLGTLDDPQPLPYYYGE